MLISAGKDCYMKFWHILPETKNSSKPKMKEENKLENSPGRGYKEWTGEPDHSESEEEPPMKKSPEKIKPKPIQKKKSPSPKKTPPPKVENPQEEESSEDDDLTGWY